MSDNVFAKVRQIAHECVSAVSNELQRGWSWKRSCLVLIATLVCVSWISYSFAIRLSSLETKVVELQSQLIDRERRSESLHASHDGLQHTVQEIQSASEHLERNLGLQLNDLGDGLSRLEHALTEQSGASKALVDELLRNIAALGICWTDTNGEKKVLWVGTGFKINSSEHVVTAGHVAFELNRHLDDLGTKDLAPEVCVVFCDGKRRLSRRLLRHPRYTQIGRAHV